MNESNIQMTASQLEHRANRYALAMVDELEAFNAKYPEPEGFTEEERKRVDTNLEHCGMLTREELIEEFKRLFCETMSKNTVIIPG